MTLTELIAKVGDANVTIERLEDRLASATAVSEGTKISFVSRAVGVGDLACPELSNKIGLVVWLPKDKALAALKS